jgi:hypothetical protein
MVNCLVRISVEFSPEVCLPEVFTNQHDADLFQQETIARQRFGVWWPEWLHRVLNIRPAQGLDVWIWHDFWFLTAQTTRPWRARHAPLCGFRWRMYVFFWRTPRVSDVKMSFNGRAIRQRLLTTNIININKHMTPLCANCSNCICAHRKLWGGPTSSNWSE